MLTKFKNAVLNVTKQHLKKNITFSAFSTATKATNEMQEEKIKVKNWDINYLKVGNGPKNVILMPGAIGSIWTDFKPQVEGLDREKFTIVAWDPPGYGKSRPPERDFPTDFYVRDADYAHGLMQALNIKNYSPLGWSDGGISSMILCAKYPEAVEKLVIWGSNSFTLPQEVDIYESIRDTKKWSKKMRDPMIEIYGEEQFVKLWSGWVDGMTNLYKANNGNICSEILKDIKCPTLILYGEKDPMVDTVHASHLHTNIVGSRLLLYPEGKHNIHIHYAEDFNKKVQDFLLQPPSGKL